MFLADALMRILFLKVRSTGQTERDCFFGNRNIWKETQSMPFKKILVADNDPAFLSGLNVCLSSEGYQVATATDGKEAFEKLRTEDPDILILNAILPKLSCFQLLQQMQKDLLMRLLPVIIFSVKKNMEAFFVDFPHVEFIYKPFDSKDLLSKIDKRIGRSSHRDPSAKKTLIILGLYKFIKNKIRKFFEDTGWEVTSTHDEKAAYEIAGRLYPDMILCEYFHPDMQGKTLDLKGFTQRMAKDRFLSRIPLYIYCERLNFLSALASYPESTLIKYTASADLLNEIKKPLGISRQ